MTDFNVSTVSREERAQFFSDMAIESLTEASEQDNEIWKPVKDSNGRYEVSNLGRVRSWSNNNNGRRETPKILKGSLDSRSYLQLDIKINEKFCHTRIHRLVAETWLPNPENKKTVNHKDGKKTNNRLSNLEWATSKENNQHAYDTGLNKQKTGRESKSLKYALVVLKDGIEVAVLYGAKEWRDFGLNQPAVVDFFGKRRKTHKGYTFDKKYL